MHPLYRTSAILILIMIMGAFAPALSAAADGNDISPKGPWASEHLYGLPGLSNVGLVAPGIYRGAQPDEEGYETLKKMGIKTVINLRALHSEQKKVTDAGMISIEIPINMIKKIDKETVEKAVTAMAAPRNQPVYLHCALGEDRTGTVVAVYRMSRQGWPFEIAFQEMQTFGFNDIWIHIRQFLEEYARSIGK